MRIALIVPGFSARSDDWAIPALLNLARGLAAKHEVHVFSQRYPAPGRYAFDGLRHEAVGGGQAFGLGSVKIWWQTAQAVVRQHRATPFDVLHAFWADEAGFSAALAGLRTGRPAVVSLGGGELTALPAIAYGAQRFLARRWTTRFALGRAAVVTAGSNYQLDLCRRHRVPAGKLRLAPLGVDVEFFRPDGQLLRPPEPPALVQAASLIPVKNQTLLLETLDLVRREIPQVKLNLAGDGPAGEGLERRTRQLGLEANVVWRRHVRYPDLPSLYRASRLYLQTSWHESQGMAVLEAMACGLPVLGTPVGVVRDVACRPPQHTAEALAGQVVEVFAAQRGAGFAALRQEARAIVERDYSLAGAVERFSALYAAVA